jgi:hypothetical protein
MCTVGGRCMRAYHETFHQGDLPLLVMKRFIVIGNSMTLGHVVIFWRDKNAAI